MDEELTRAARQAVDAGRSRWPSLTAEENEVFRFAQRLAISARDLQRHGADVCLAAACARRDPAALDAFDEAFLAPLGAQLTRLRLSADEMDEVRQLLRIRMLTGPEPRIGRYNATAPLGVWLRVIAVRTAINLLETRKGRWSVADESDASIAAGLAAASSETDLPSLKAKYVPIFQRALESSIASLDARDRSLVWFHFVEGLGIDALGAIYGVHRATAARWLNDVTDRLFSEVRRKLQADLQVSASAFASLLSAVRPELRATLTRLIEPPPRALRR